MIYAKDVNLKSKIIVLALFSYARIVKKKCIGKRLKLFHVAKNLVVNLALLKNVKNVR